MRAVRLFSRPSSRLAALLVSGVLLGCGSILPDDWPIKELTLPRGCKLAAKPQMMAGMDSLMEAFPGDQSWEVCFNYDKGWDALVAHIDQRLASIGYRPSNLLGDMSDMLGSSEQQDQPWQQMMPDLSNFSRMYSKQDSDYMITLMNYSMFKGMEGKPEDEVASFSLTVTKYGTSLPPPIRTV